MRIANTGADPEALANRIFIRTGLDYRNGGADGHIDYDGKTIFIESVTEINQVNHDIIRTLGIASGRDQNIQRLFFEQMNSMTLIASEFTEGTGAKAAQGVRAVPAGAGAAVTLPAPGYDMTDHPGVWEIKTGTTAAGRVFIISQGTGAIGTLHVGVGGITRTGTWFQTETNLSVPLERYTLRAGFFSIALPNTILDGIGFEYDDSQNGGRWQAICYDGAETSVDTGVTVVADTYYYLDLEVNADGTSVEFFIDGLPVATITTNIPSGTGFSLFYNTMIMKLIGTTSRAARIDAYYIYQELTR